ADRLALGWPFEVFLASWAASSPSWKTPARTNTGSQARKMPRRWAPPCRTRDALQGKEQIEGESERKRQESPAGKKRLAYSPKLDLRATRCDCRAADLMILSTLASLTMKDYLAAVPSNRPGLY